MGRCKGAGDDAEPRLIFRCRDVGLLYALKDSLTGSKAVEGRERESGYDKPAGSMAAAYWSLCRGVWLREAIITVVGRGVDLHRQTHLIRHLLGAAFPEQRLRD